jgi:hypothetical protein
MHRTLLQLFITIIITIIIIDLKKLTNRFIFYKLLIIKLLILYLALYLVTMFILFSHLLYGRKHISRQRKPYFISKCSIIFLS